MSDKKDQLTIPKKIKVGFQKRSDTYSGKLAYVVFIDDKGVLRKEKSWEGWRDKKIDAEEFVNEPTQGFVLNKDVGGSHRSYSWNARREKVRVYDPRNFEFEISVENLLFVLQECSSIKGKGLEGEFVYSWAGPELVLLPIGSQEYKNSSEFTSLQKEKVSAKDIKEGCTYLTKKQEEVMYLGKFPWYAVKGRYHEKVLKGESKHVFIFLNKLGKKIEEENYLLQSGFTGIAKRISDSPISQFAEEFDRLSKSNYVSKPVKIYLSEEPIKYKENDYTWGYKVGVEKNGVIYYGNCSRNGDGKTFRLECRNRLSLSANGAIGFHYCQDSYSYYSRGNPQGFCDGGFRHDTMTFEELQTTAHKVIVLHENGSTSDIY